MASCPEALVMLAEPKVVWSLGSKPPMIFGLLGSVTSRSVIRVALPNLVMALRPSKIGWEVLTTGMPSAPVLATLLGSSFTVLGKTSGARLMANDPRPKVVARSRSGSGVAVGLIGSYGPAMLGMPVWTLMLPSERSRSVTEACGRLPPWATAPKVVLGNRDHVRPSSMDW